MRAVRRWIRLMGPFGAIAVLGTWNGCRVFQRSDLSPQRLELSVRNNSYFDVDVYVVQSASGSVVRAGTVTGNSSSTLRVRVTDLQPGGLLAVRLHAIGSNRMWTSPSVSVVEGAGAMLEIYSDPSGNLSRSTLYPTLPRDTSSAVTH